jgi:hypothetical protein
MPRIAGEPTLTSLLTLQGPWLVDLAGPNELAEPLPQDEDNDMSTPAAIFAWSAGGTSGDMGQSITGEWISMQGFRQVSFTFVWTGVAAPTGTLAFEISNDAVTPFAFPGTFSPAIVSPAGSAGTQMCDDLFTNAAYIRAKYTRSGGGAGDTIVGIHQRKV